MKSLIALCGVMVACTEPGPKPTPPVVDDTRATLAETCQRGEPTARADACVALGELVAADRPSTPIAESWYALGCQRGSLRGCGLLGGALLVRGEAVSAYPLLDRACGGGDAVGCFNLAWILAAGQGGVAADPARALTLYEAGCARGLGAACQNRAWMSERGVSTKVDLHAAADWYGHGCQAGSAASCTALGLMTRDGRGVPADRLNARTLFAKACELGDPAACEAERSLP